MKITIRRPDDLHVHLRDGAMMEAVTPFTSAVFGRALVMPNVPVIETALEALEYRDRINAAVPLSCRRHFKPLMTIKLTHRTTPFDIVNVRNWDVYAAKIYPTGATTASHDGISDVELLAPVFEAMQRVGMVLCIHGEDPSAFVLDRELCYLSRVQWIIRKFPGLKVVLEHITTMGAVKFVQNASVNVAATITAHHLVMTLDDVLGSGIRPHAFCYPVAKTPDDREALIDAAVRDESGKFFFGSDTAPHLRSAKESACGCAGVFSAPVALPVLVDVFVRAIYGAAGTRNLTSCLTAAHRLERFASVNGARFYGLPLNEGTITLVDEPWEVPPEIGGVQDQMEGVVPFRAGETLGWRVLAGPARTAATDDPPEG